MRHCIRKRRIESNSWWSATTLVLGRRKEGSWAEGSTLLSPPFSCCRCELISRGLAGTVLVYKIAGALASRGAGLDEVYDVAEWVSQRIGTIGVGLEHCHVSKTSQNTAIPVIF